MKVSKNIYYRFENDIEEGVLYIFNYSKQEIVKSNYFSYIILDLINNNKSKSEIVDFLKNIYEEYSENELKDFVDNIIEYFKQYEFIEE